MMTLLERDDIRMNACLSVRFYPYRYVFHIYVCDFMCVNCDDIGDADGVII